MTPRSLFAMVEWAIRSPPPMQRIRAPLPSPSAARRLHRPRPRGGARDHAHLCRRPRRARQGRQEPGHRRRPCRRGDHRRRPAHSSRPTRRWSPRRRWRRAACPSSIGGPFWLVDPLDGTKEFIKRNGEFTVNIALIEDGRPTLGIVLAPASRHAVARRGGTGRRQERERRRLHADHDARRRRPTA